MTPVVRRALLGGALGLAVLLALRTFVVEIYTVPSASMAPTLLAGDWLLVNRLASKVERGDVIIFELHGQSYVKRVLGVPGDHIESHNGELSINGTPVRSEPRGDVSLDEEGMPITHSVGLASSSLLRESWGGRHWDVARFRGAPPESRSWTVPPGDLFVLGDNRDDSFDSRDPAFGFVPRSAVRGRVTRVLWSIGQAGVRAGRWFLHM